jgi:hypothetical protein
MYIRFAPRSMPSWRNCRPRGHHWAVALLSLKRHRLALVVVGAIAAPIPAAAQQPSSEPAAQAQGTSRTVATRPLRLAIKGLTPGSEVRVVSRSVETPGASQPAASCSQDCELELQKGEYTLIASRGDDQRTKEVELTSSQILKVGEWDGRVRTFGTILGITGIVVGTLSTLVTVAMAMSSGGSAGGDASTDSTPGILLIAPAGIVVGLGLTIGGFSLAAANRAPSMGLDRMPMTYPPPGSPAACLSWSGQF